MTKKTIYQAVTSMEPFLVTDFLDFEKASKNDCHFFIEKKYSKTHTTNYSGSQYEIYNYRFIDKAGEEFIVKKNEWTIEEIGKGYFGSEDKNKFGEWTWSDWNDYLISDSKGGLRKIGFSSPKLAFKYFTKFSQFPNWQEYEIHSQIDDILES